MKEIIYLDTSYLNSFIAQMNQGLPTSTTNEFQESETSTSTKGKTSEFTNTFNAEAKTGGINLGGVFESPAAKLGYILARRRGTNNSISLAQSDTGKEIIVKQLHDNALLLLEEHLIQQNLLVDVSPTDSADIGKYIKIKAPFKIMDLEYFKHIIGPELTSIMSAFTPQNHEQQALLQKEINKINSSDKAPHRKKKNVEKLKKESQSAKQAEIIDNLRLALDFCSLALPSSSFFKQGNFVAPLKTGFLRETSKEILFKYGKENQILEAVIIGKVTRKFDSNLNNEALGFMDFLNSFNSQMELLMTQIDLINFGDYIVSPIAIYFE